MAGIYIHIPYCKQACTYCDFYFSTNTTSKPQLVQALVQELQMRKGFFEPGTVIQTIYLGGGTPSLLTKQELFMLLQAVHELYAVDAAAEVTLEANPDDVTTQALAVWKQAGINRLSIGIQSFRDQDLRFMNRAHTASHAEACVHLAHDAGYENITIDLIYDILQMDDAAWQRNIEQAIALGVPHISAYGLTVEPRTVLAHQVATGQVPLPDDAQFARNFTLLVQLLEQAGYEHYEISNFAKPGRQSRHNTAYWMGKPYLGIGPSAHSFNGKRTRSWNVRNLHLYIEQLAANVLPTHEEELLTEAQVFNEIILTRLRTKQGLPLQLLPPGWQQQVRAAWQAQQEAGYLVMEGGHLRLTQAGKLFADGIAAQLMLPDDFDISVFS
jgi:oxygen-independent coproporphyrinogen-3 oxidase